MKPGWKYNYGDPDLVVDQQIFINAIDTLGPDSILLHLNTVAQWCDTCPGYLQLDLPQFLQRSILVTNGAWFFHDPSPFLILPQTDLGGSWLADTMNSVLAEITDVDTLLEFGVVDIQKTIQFSNGDQWVISKEWGVLRMNDHQLIGIHGADVGFLVPSIHQMYPYQAGDVVEYKKYGHFGSNNYSIHTDRLRHGILDRSDTDSLITFDTWLTRWRTTSIPTGSTQFYTSHYYNTDESELITSSVELPYRDLLFSYPGAPSTTEHQITSSSPQGFCIASHSRDSLDRYVIGCELPQQTGTTSFVSGSVAYIQGIGLYDYSIGFEYYRWIGSVISGDTLGTVHSDDYFLDITETSSTSLLISPNPASDNLFVRGMPNGTSDLVMLDMTGRVVLRRTLIGPDGNLDLRSLPEGMYTLHGPEGYTPAKVMIQR